ncbi:MAG: hypothetical protein JST59_12210 [Actinobacteria bacterium]|nr:hypothetical protein [Actinomycetota bacterium]
MRFDLSDLDRLTGFADALERLFWCLIVVGLFAAILGSPGTGLFLLILGAAAFVVRVGLEDFVRSRGRRKEPAAPKKAAPPKELVIEKKTKPAAKRKAAPEPEFNVYRTSRRPRRKKSAV